MEPLICNGWKIYFHPLFLAQLDKQISRVKFLKSKLSSEDFVKHPEVKALQAFRRGIKEIIPSDPFAPRFRFDKTLSKYGRLKDMGIPDRYRLFFRATDLKGMKQIVILWLGYPREEGSRNDCYEVFRRKVASGHFPDNINELIKECESSVQGF